MPYSISNELPYWSFSVYTQPKLPSSFYSLSTQVTADVRGQEWAGVFFYLWSHLTFSKEK